MGKRGPKPGFNIKKRISQKWTSELAYAIGLLATDGCLASKSALIDLTSKDREQLENYIACLSIPLSVTKKRGSNGKTYLRVQFRSIIFYDFLLSIGLTPRKSKTLGRIAVPKKYFWDLLRGEYDGDGSSYAYWDKRWRSSFMFYTAFVSASAVHIDWLREEIFSRLGIPGHVTVVNERSLFQLRYAKSDSLMILRKMYYSKDVICLSRKRLKVEGILDTVAEKL